MNLLTAIHIQLIWNVFNITLILLHAYKVKIIIPNLSSKTVNERDECPLENGNEVGHLGHTFRFKQLILHYSQW